MLDLYHAQIGEGNLIALCRKALPFIGEIQVADVPGRCEPFTGEINYPAVAKALHEMGYAGTVGLEAWASADDERALERFGTYGLLRLCTGFSVSEREEEKNAAPCFRERGCKRSSLETDPRPPCSPNDTDFRSASIRPGRPCRSGRCGCSTA
jgi:hypothetical protein